METLILTRPNLCSTGGCIRKNTAAIKKACLFILLLTTQIFCTQNAHADTFYWTGNGGNTSWSNNSNWYDYTFLGLVAGHPTSGDVAYIGSNSPILNINYFTGSFNPTVNTASACAALYIGENKSATLTASSALTISGDVRVYSGSTINATATVTVSGNSATVTNAGTITLTGATLALTGGPVTFTSSGTVSVLSASTFSVTGNNSTATNTGTFTVTSSTFNYSSTAGSATFTNTSPGTFTATSSSINFLSGTGNTLTNTGSFSASASPITFSLGNCTLNNSGTFTASSTSTITLPGNNSSIKNTAGTFTTTATNILLNGQPSSMQNSGTGIVAIGGATITMAQNAFITNAGTGSFTINGTSVVNFGYGSYFTNSATFYAGTSASPCTLNMTQQDDNITNNSSSVFYLGSTSIINLTGFHATVTNNGRFTLQSDAAGSAAISNISGGGSAGLTGFYNVERFLTGGGLAANRGYRMLSSPVNENNATASASTFGLSYLNQHTYLNVSYAGAYTGGSGGSTNGFSGTSVGPTIYLYKEPLAASNTSYTSGKHVGIVKITTNGTPTSTTIGTTATVNTTHATDAPYNLLSIPIGNGFLMYFAGPSSRTTGSSSIPPQDATITANGYLNQGSFVVHLWYNLSGVNTLSFAATLNPGYSMVGNPYPSTINLATVASQNSGIDIIYVLNSRAGGVNQNYIAYSSTGGASSPLTQQYAVSGGGFIVHALSGAATLTFNESQKAPTINPTGTGLIMSAPKANVLAVDGNLGNGTLSATQQRTMAMPAQTGTGLSGLFMKMEKDSTVYDYCGIYFGSNYNAKFENGDALYLAGPTTAVNMSSLTADRISAAVNNLPDYHNGSRVKLYINATGTGIYKLKLEGVRNIDTLYDIYLLDHFTKDSLDIRRYGVYNFNLNKTDTSTFGANRFELSIRRKPLPQYLLTYFEGAKAQTGLNVTWKTQNERNYTGFTLEKQVSGSTDFNPVYEKQSDGSAVYTFLDSSPNSGNNTYRLKQNNIDGQISYSQPITVFYDKLAGNGLINVFPNPTAEMINVSIPAPANNHGSYRMKVYNSSGYAVMQKTIASNNWSENVGSFRPGMYVVEVVKSDGTSIGKVKFIKN